MLFLVMWMSPAETSRSNMTQDLVNESNNLTLGCCTAGNLLVIFVRIISSQVVLLKDHLALR